MIGGGAEDDRAKKKFGGDTTDLANTHKGMDDAEAEKLMRFLHPDERRVRLLYIYTKCSIFIYIYIYTKYIYAPGSRLFLPLSG